MRARRRGGTEVGSGRRRIGEEAQIQGIGESDGRKWLLMLSLLRHGLGIITRETEGDGERIRWDGEFKVDTDA